MEATVDGISDGSVAEGVVCKVYEMLGDLLETPVDFFEGDATLDARDSPPEPDEA